MSAETWLKWFPADWRAEQRLRMVSRAARSLWVDLICVMAGGEPHGFLIVARQTLTTPALVARLLGDTEAEIAPLLAELEDAGVFSRVGDADLPEDVAALIPAGVPAGTIFSRKMVRDKARSDKKRAAGSMGGNPNLLPSNAPVVNPQVKQVVNQQVKPSIQYPDTSIPFLRNGAAGEGKSGNGTSDHSKPYAKNDREWLWSDGLNWLSERTERPVAGLRSQIGKWLKTAKDDSAALRSAFEAAQDQGVAEPIAWITAALEHRAKAAAPFDPTDERGWRKRLTVHKQSGEWPASWGGKCPGDHPAHPTAILAEFGFQSRLMSAGG